MSPSLHAPQPARPPFRIIVLVGLMGAGKTTLGRMLAQHYGIPFIDTDAEIEKASRQSIPEIFAHHGEAHFRAGEHRVIRRLLKNGPCILATGGGAWMHPQTRALIHKAADVCAVWLHVPMAVLLRRLLNNRGSRPLLAQGDPAATLRQLATVRYPRYAEADIIIDCGDESVEQATRTITDTLANTSLPHHVPVALAGHSYEVLIGRELLAQAGLRVKPHLPNGHAIILTDETVATHHLATLERSFREVGIRFHTVIVPPGEGSKSLARFEAVMEEMLERGIERGTTVIALGGGVIGDLAGFVAATALRGIPFIQIPTTLLAQVDSSVGGKTGINARAGKNLIGAFWQPRLVLADTETLATLPRRQLVAGYAEIVKAGLIADAELFAWCEANGQAVLEGEPEKLGEAVRRACAFKAGVVQDDEREQAGSGGRALLNLGHTFAHAFEAEFHYDGRLLHGEAVSIGLHMALALSVRMGLAPEDDLARLDTHLHALGMPAGAADLPHGLSTETLLNHMGRDKKLRDGKITFVLLRGIGMAFTCRDVAMDDVRALLLAEGFAP
ncbi:3-dehydroquinate synthase [Bombella sp. ESL0380]|uniref:3-dehydroquinate synthase n=1 Tax=Bombella sp. ESL0380 TaxID=2676444 RepID=UPI00139DB596|nr:3-dehydroquinate synthase [Bombella sp. ESL0380]